MNDSHKLRFAIVGCGGAARDYGACCHRLRDAAVVAVADPLVSNARMLAGELDASIVASSLEELLDKYSAEFDAAILVSADTSLDSDCLRAAEAGKHVLSQIAASDESMQQLEVACEATGARWALATKARFSPAVREIRRALDAGQLGLPGLLRIHRWETSDNGDQNAKWSARLLSEIDLAIWFFHSIPDSMHALVRQVSSSSGADYFQLHFGFADGGMVVIDATSALPRGDTYHSLSLIGSTGAAYADDHHNMQLLYRGGPPTALKTGIGRLGILFQLEEFVDAIRKDRNPVPGIDEAKQAIQVMSAVQDCLDSGRPMRLEGDGYEFV